MVYKRYEAMDVRNTRQCHLASCSIFVRGSENEKFLDLAMWKLKKWTRQKDRCKSSAKRKYSVALITDIRNELLQFHEVDGQIGEIRFLRHEHISSSIWWYQHAYANPCGQRIFLRFLMLMKFQYPSASANRLWCLPEQKYAADW